MNADFHSDRSHSNRPDSGDLFLRRRSAGARHRPSVGAIRLVKDQAGEWSLTPITKPTHYVGRVGALAVALGVGGMIMGLPALAAADPDPGSTDTSETSAAGTPGPSKPSPRDAGRGGPAERPSGYSSGPGGIGDANAGVRSGRTSDSAPAPSRSNRNLRDGVQGPASRDGAQGPASRDGAAPNSPAPAVEPGAAVAPRASLADIVEQAPAAAADVRPGRESGAGAAGVGDTGGQPP